MTNWARYLGTPEAASHTEVVWHSWPFRISVSVAGQMSACTCEHRLVANFDTEDAFREWLSAEHDDGTIVFEG